ncbi:MAG: hypothetical protein ABIK49_07180 [candidate division WOR-3 bacterium]
MATLKDKVRFQRKLLRYVYRRYPEYTTKSEIIDRIIGKTHQSD